MKKQLLALLALVALLAGCPSHPAPEVDASAFEAGLALDAAIESGAPHRLGSFNPTCSGSGYPIVVSGVQQSACGTLGAGVATFLATPSGANFTAALSTTLPSVSVGTAPVAAAGLLRFPNAPGTISAVRDGSNAADWRVASATSTNLTFGDNANLWSVVELQAGSGGVAKVTGHDIQIFAQTTLGTDLEVNSQYVLWLKADSIWAAQPIIGHTINSSPWGVHGKTTVATAPPFTVAAADYAMDAIMLSNAGAGTVTFPTPADDAHAFYKTVINTGAGSKTLSDGIGSTPALATNLSGRFLFDRAGVHLTGTAVAYP